MRARFDSGYIEAELERIGEAIETPLTVYLIGGGASGISTSRICSRWYRQLSISTSSRTN